MMSIENLLFDEDPNFQISVKAAFLQNRANEGLCVPLAYHARHKKYMFPGGRVEIADLKGGFGLEDALARELKEELGLNFWSIYNRYYDIYDLATPKNMYMKYWWQNGEVDKLDICFLFYLSAGYKLPFEETALPQGSEIDHVKWFSVYSTTSSLFPNTRSILNYIPKFLNEF